MERRVTIPLEGGVRDYDALLDLVADAPLVLIGEATHGTHEFYRTRADITKRLIAERNFTAVCIEGDWPDAYRVNRFVRGASDDVEAVESLAGFKRFPTWMWRNAEVLDFVSWLREYNSARLQAMRSSTVGSPKTSISTRKRTLGSSQTPKSTIARCLTTISPLGTFAMHTWWIH